MWFHLLSVATFLALGSCLDYYGHIRKQNTSDCIGLNCPCNCPDKSCAPCPIPEPIECFSGCGTPECPCVKSTDRQRSHSPQLGGGMTEAVHRVVGLSTVNVKPTGPVCTASNLLPHMMMTVSTCVAGIAVEDLYVTVFTPQLESLKVKEIVTEPYNIRRTGPVLLITEKPKKVIVNGFGVPPVPINPSKVTEVQKFQVIENGAVYLPTLTTVASHRICFPDDKFICAETYNTTVMGWNDIGSVLVEVLDTRTIQGMYIGASLYEPTNIIKYMPIHDYADWLFAMVEKYT